MNKRSAQDNSETTAETSFPPNAYKDSWHERAMAKRSRPNPDVGTSAGGGCEAAAPRRALRGEGEAFGVFATRILKERLPSDVAGLKEVAALCTHAANAILRAAEEEAELRSELETHAAVVQMQKAELQIADTRLNEEILQRQELSRKVHSLSLMAPLVEKCRQESRDARIAQFAALSRLELCRAEVAKLTAENAELKMALIALENAPEEEEDAARVGQA